MVEARHGNSTAHPSQVRALGTMAPSAFSPPADYPRIRIVQSFEELAATPFADGINAFCWRRTLAGDFDEVARQLTVDEAMVSIDEARLAALPLSAAGRAASDTMAADLERLRRRDLSPVLDCVSSYPR